jgi:anthranilate synthase component 1
MFGSKALVQESQLLRESFTPKFKKFPLKFSPNEVFSRLYQHFDNTYILESVVGPKKLAQYSFIGFDPKLTFCIKNQKVIIRNRKKCDEIKDKVTDPLSIVRELVGRELTLYRGLRLIGGAVGYISYDAVRYWERIPDTTVDDLDFPKWSSILLLS